MGDNSEIETPHSCNSSDEKSSNNSCDNERSNTNEDLTTPKNNIRELKERHHKISESYLGESSNGKDNIIVISHQTQAHKDNCNNPETSKGVDSKNNPQTEEKDQVLKATSTCREPREELAEEEVSVSLQKESSNSNTKSDSPIRISKEPEIEWDDPDLLLALSALTTKDEGEDEEEVSIPSIDIDPSNFFIQDDQNFQNIFDKEDNQETNQIDIKDLSLQFLLNLDINTREDKDTTKLNDKKDEDIDTGLYCTPCDSNSAENINQFVKEANILRTDKLLEDTLFENNLEQLDNLLSEKLHIQSEKENTTSHENNESDEDNSSLVHCTPCDDKAADNIHQFIQDANILRLDKLLEETLFDNLEQEGDQSETEYIQNSLEENKTLKAEKKVDSEHLRLHCKPCDTDSAANINKFFEDENLRLEQSRSTRETVVVNLEDKTNGSKMSKINNIEEKLTSRAIGSNDEDVDSGLLCKPCGTDSAPNMTQFLGGSNILPLEQLVKNNANDNLRNESKREDGVRVPSTSSDENIKIKSYHTSPKVNDEEPSSSVDKSDNIMSCLLESFENAKKWKSCIGHKETIFGLSFSPSGKWLATASQDSTIGIWNVETQSRVAQLRGHSEEYECLRVAWSSDTKLASAGADGCVKIWEKETDESGHKWSTAVTLNHCKSHCDGKVNPTFQSENSLKKIVEIPNEDTEDTDGREKEEDSTNVPQIYTLQFIEEWHLSDTYACENILMTSSDDYIHLWSANDYEKIMDINFTSLEMGYGGVFVDFVSSEYVNSASTNGPNGTKQNQKFLFPMNTSSTNKPFGGPRNPENLIFVFDASYCANNGLLGVALSDGTLRLLNGRGICMAILQLPGCQSHLTSFAWDSSGKRLASCVATGHLILWEIDIYESYDVQPTCIAILEGGHTPGRPLYGAKYFGDQDELIITWGVDGRLCLWDSNSQGQVYESLAVLVSRSNYPIYIADYKKEIDCNKSTSIENNNKNKKIVSRIAFAGGRDPGFLGVPFYIYDIINSSS